MNTAKLVKIMDSINSCEANLKMTRDIRRENFKNTIYNAWLQLGITREHLAAKMGVNKSTISKWFNGRYTPRYTKVYYKKMIDILKVEKEKILDELSKDSAL